MGQTKELTGKENQKRKNIALIIAMLQSDFSASFVEGAVKGAAGYVLKDSTVTELNQKLADFFDF